MSVRSAAMAPSPALLVQRFRTANDCYLYDVGSNQFVRVHEDVHRQLGDRGWASAGGSPQSGGAGDHGSERRALAEIERLLRANVLSPRRPERLALGYTRQEYRRTLQTGMEHLILEVTTRCNLRCTYCVYGGAHLGYRSHGRVDLSFDMARKAVDYFLRHSVNSSRPTISFYGGEPLLDLECLQRVVEHVRRHRNRSDVCFQATTNATQLREESIRFFVSNDVALNVSLDGPARIHDAHRKTGGGAGTHARIVENLERLRDYDRRFFDRRVSMLCTIEDPADAQLIAAFFESRGFHCRIGNVNFAIHPIAPRRQEAQSRFPRTRGIEALLERYVSDLVSGTVPPPFLKALFDRRFLPIHLRERRPVGHAVPLDRTCMPGATRLFCTADGQYRACEKVPTGRIGHVDCGVDAEQAYSLVVRYARSWRSKCLSCWASRLCALCPIAMDDDVDSPANADRCDRQREELLFLVPAYLRALELNPDAFSFLGAGAAFESRQWKSRSVPPVLRPNVPGRHLP